MRRVRHLLSVGAGAFLLGELGDLRATTWAGQRERLRDYEVGEVVDARVVENEDGRLFTGGVAAGMDGGLELVRELFGDEVARGAAHLDYPFWEPTEAA